DIQATVDGRSVDLGPLRRRCVLATLLVDANHHIPAEELVERIWSGRPPQRPREALYSYLSRLRQTIGSTNDVRIAWQAGGYVLPIGPMSVDLARFHCLLARARAADDDDTALRLLDDVLLLWRGPTLAGLDTPWLNDVRDVVERQRLAAELDRNDLAL